MNEDFNTVVSAAVLLIVGLFVVSQVFGAMPASETRTVENETITIDVGNSTQVEQSHGEHYYDNETVWNSTGSELTEGTDYEWHTDNASVQWFDTSSTNDGSDGNITYSFDQRPQMARDVLPTISDSFSLGAVALIVLIAAVILAHVARFNDGSGGRSRF